MGLVHRLLFVKSQCHVLMKVISLGNLRESLATVATLNMHKQSTISFTDTVIAWSVCVCVCVCVFVCVHVYVYVCPCRSDIVSSISSYRQDRTMTH